MSDCTQCSITPHVLQLYDLNFSASVKEINTARGGTPERISILEDMHVAGLLAITKIDSSIGHKDFAISGSKWGPVNTISVPHEVATKLNDLIKDSGSATYVARSEGTNLKVRVVVSW